MSSPKGRVLLSKSARAIGQSTASREGSCAWCAKRVIGPETPNPDCPVICPRCGSTEIDWITPPPPPENHYTRDEAYVPGLLACALQGATIHGRK